MSSPSTDNLEGTIRSRSNSIRNLMSSQNSSSTQQQKKSFGRSMSVSDGLHVKLPMLHHSETEPNISSPLSQTSINNIYPSESNWANKYEDFDIGKPIGYGSSAVVYEAIYKPLKKKVAIKMIDLDMFERNQIDELRRETALMALSKHPNVLRVYGSFVNGSKLYIVTPYLAAGSCLDIMKTAFPEGLDEISIATILRQALEGLVYLHKNGHIHRDVKAGNLLMDQQGTVLLADFGVSSSLTDNSDVRKTFVGTPCWMAPEVMEQAGYNYKADIWSFGITSLELANGHAPFAKYPPMKVLMMTLSNAPPTLDRDNGKHKYSKTFKDMIDSCLQKDPTKRPSAEKLLLHPFFKQAKKRDYLVKSILQYVPPLDQRPHKKVPQKHISFEATEQWDFDDQEDTPAATPIITTTPATSQEALTPPLSTAATPERTKSVVQFEECPKPIHVKKHTPSSSIDTTEHTPIKKHISFGEAIIREPSRTPINNNSTIDSPYPLTPSSTHESNNHVAPILSSAPTSRKSRFVIEDNTPQQPDLLANTSPAATISAHSSPTDAVGLGISNTTDSNSNTVPGAMAVNHIASNNNTLQEGEFKKGRFSVNQTSTRSVTPIDDTNATISNTEKPQTPHVATPMQRVASQDSFNERKSRFEVKHTNNSTGCNTPIEPFQSFPLSREGSNTSALSRDSSKVSRFSIEKPTTTTTEIAGPYCELPPIESRKKGRFELTGGDIQHESPQSTVIGQSPTLPMYSQLEYLLRQNEIQKVMLQELITNMHYQRNRTLSDTTKRPSFSQPESLSQDISSTIEHLQELLLTSNKEKERLARENEAMKKEIERLKRQQHAV